MPGNCTTADEIGWDCPQVPVAIAFALGAGLATGIGGAIVFFPSLMRAGRQATLLAISLALSAGVMLYVSFIEIFVKSYDEIALTSGISEGGASAVTTACFFAGMLFCVLLEVIVHKLNERAGAAHHCPAHADHVITSQDVELATSHAADEHVDGGSAGGSCEKRAAETEEVSSTQPSSGASAEEQQPALAPVTTVNADGKLVGHTVPTTAAVDVTMEFNEKVRGELGRMGMLAALAIAVHNFPEGLATFMATLNDYKVGASLGTAIAIHNIPEGICVAMPIYYATGSKWKAFGWSLLSGITEPIGGIVGFAVLQPVFTPLVFGIVFSMVGGMMVFIVMHELLPAAHRYMGDSAKATAWLIMGMLIMALSLVLMKDFNNSLPQEGQE